MSLIGQAISRRTSSTILDAIRRSGRQATASGQIVTPDRAMRHGAVWASTNLIADTVSAMPIDAYVHDGRRNIEQPSQRMLDEPSAEVDAVDWRRQAIVSDLMRGNAFGVVAERDRQMRPTQVEIAHPDHVTWSNRRKFEPLQFKVNGEPIADADLWHMPAYVMPGSPLGLSPIAVAAQAIGLGLAAEQYGARWYDQDAHPTAVLATDKILKDSAEAELTRQQYLDAIKEHGVAVMGAGFKYDAVQIAPADSAFLETTQANIATIARYFGIDPSMIGGKSGDSQTYSNVESKQLSFLTFNLNTWIVRVERHLSRLLPQGMFAKFNPDALARMQLITRYQAHSVALRSGFKNVDEVRELENDEPLPDGKGQQFAWPPLRAFPIDSDQEPPKGDDT